MTGAAAWLAVLWPVVIAVLVFVLLESRSRAHRAASRAAASAALAWGTLEHLHRAAVRAHAAGVGLTLEHVTEVVANAARLDRDNRTDD